MDLTAEALFRHFLLPLYPPEMRENLAAVRTTDTNPANNPHILAKLDEIADTFAAMAPETLGAPDLELDRSDASVHRLGAALTRERRDALLERSGEKPPPLVHLLAHGAVYVGACVVTGHGGRWLVRNPLWESQVELESRAGTAHLAPLQWWLKSLSDAEVDDRRLADRYRMHVEVPTAEPEALPIISDPSRPLPRLKQPRYDTLVRYLKKHLPELTTVGPHFPAPEKFSSMGFHWLDFAWLGGGRMLLLHGPTDRGIHLFWLDASGFSSAAYFPADAHPAHEVRQEGDKLVVTVPVLGSPQTHEMLWWGPNA